MLSFLSSNGVLCSNHHCCLHTFRCKNKGGFKYPLQFHKLTQSNHPKRVYTVAGNFIHTNMKKILPHFFWCGPCDKKASLLQSCQVSCFECDSQAIWPIRHTWHFSRLFPHSILYIYFFHDINFGPRASSNSNWLTDWDNQSQTNPSVLCA